MGSFISDNTRNATTPTDASPQDVIAGRDRLARMIGPVVAIVAESIDNPGAKHPGDRMKQSVEAVSMPPVPEAPKTR